MPVMLVDFFFFNASEQLCSSPIYLLPHSVELLKHVRLRRYKTAFVLFWFWIPFLLLFVLLFISLSISVIHSWTPEPPQVYFSLVELSLLSGVHNPHFCFCLSDPFRRYNHSLLSPLPLVSLYLPWGRLTFVALSAPPSVLDWHVKPLSLVPWLLLTSLTSLLAGG